MTGVLVVEPDPPPWHVGAPGYLQERWAKWAPEGGTSHDARGTNSMFVNWDKFWEKDRTQEDWHVEDFLAKGRGHAAYAGRKVGKSLFALAQVAAAATGPQKIAAIYLDYEMGDDDLYERAQDMGYGPHTDLSRLHYALLPTLPPLDTAAGAAEMERIINTVEVTHPDHDLIVVIDTTSRAVTGDENDAGTIQAFYRHTGMLLKQRGVTWLRLDHAGKDADKGQRGSSAKGDDVDIVWRLSRTDQGIRLTRDLARMSWVPEQVNFAQLDSPLRYTRVADAWPAGTAEVATLLDSLEVPVDAGRRPASAALRDAGQGRRAEVVLAALRFRRTPDYVGNHPRNHACAPRGDHQPEPPEATAC